MSSLVAGAGVRHGLVLPPQEVPRTFAEPGGIVNIAVPERAADGWRSVAGGIARTRQQAEEAAVGEALERYAAHVCELPCRTRAEVGCAPLLDLEEFSLYAESQRRRADFPHRALYEAERTYTNAFDLAGNRETWVPFELVGLSWEGAGVATSSGLAAGPTPLDAVLRAVQELVERDALMVTWLHGVPGRQVELGPAYAGEVAALGGEVVCVDATPAYSPHPVALVAGWLPLRGVPRYSLGAACRATWAAAAEKAYLEWLQGVAFVGYYRDFHPVARLRSPADVKTFDDHAVYYSLRPEQWPRIPLLQGELTSAPPDGPASLEALAAALAAAGIRVFYRELTTSDVRQAGAFVVRAVSPDLAPIHCDEQWPFLGGSVSDVRRRYLWAPSSLPFPSPYPHPLG
jgi:ribosomal protein S12 methylthiotransferase accessory factor